MENWEYSLKVIFLAAIIGTGMLGCIEPPIVNPDLPDVPAGDMGQLKRFANYGEMTAAFEEAGGGDMYRGGEWDILNAIMPAMAESTGADSGMQKSASAPGAGRSYSETNVQVQGVDEADIVKTDGRYIYNLSGESLVITDAYPIIGSKIVSETELKDVWPQEMFVRGDKLLIFGQKNVRYDYYSMPMMDMPYYGGSRMVVQLYDVSDRAAPKLEKEIEFEGSYVTSRLIGGDAYFVVNSSPYYGYMYAEKGEGEEENIIPRMYVDGVESRVATPNEIGYVPPMPCRSFVTIVSLNLESMKMNKDTIAGSADNVYASEGNIYLGSTVWRSWEPRPLLDEMVGGRDYSEKTVINKFSLDAGKIKFEGQGRVPGHVLNQFSMDEFNGNFRIAVTAGQLSRSGSETTNNLYVLDGKMEIIGKLEDLAPGESIYSARFMGERAYLVTFKKVDPLFVIDVSNPKEPKVLGKLKIPGYSDYLHPMDATHLIGVGKDTMESTYGDFAWYQGMKIAVFDVSDVENPKEMHKIIVGDRGTDSYALNDHKAFLYDAEKELLVLPIMLAEISEAEKAKQQASGRDSPAYGEQVFQGAFVWKLTLENGFEEKGRITHVSKEEEMKRGYYYGSDSQVKRALYIEDVLYTLSDKMLKASDLDTLKDLRDFVFTKTETTNYDYYE